jgi:hypothetical protein
VTLPFIVNFATSPPLHLTASEAISMIHSDQFPGNLYNSEIDIQAFPSIWPAIFKPKYARLTSAELEAKHSSKKVKYSQNKRQWSRTTRRQLANSDKLLKVIKTLEFDIDNCSELFTEFSEPRTVQQIVFNVMLTVSFWDWNSASYVSEMLHLVWPLLETVVSSVREDEVTTPAGEVIPIEVAESEIFWYFTTFFSGMKIGDVARPSDQPFVMPVFVNVRTALRECFPGLLQVFGPRIDGVLDWLTDEMKLWFARIFHGEELRRLWVAAASGALEFFSAFVIAILFMVEPGRDFRNRSLDLNTLLVNTTGINTEVQRKKKAV